MRRWSKLVLAGALCCPTVSLAQYKPATTVSPAPAAMATMPKTAAPMTGGVSFHHPTVPDVSGMPGAETDPGLERVALPPQQMSYPGPGGGPGFGHGGGFGPAGCCPDEPACKEHPCGLFLYGEGIWWKARRTATAFRLDTTVIDPVTGVALRSSDELDFETDYEVGGRGGIGCLTHDGWFVLATYTRFKDDSDVQAFESPLALAADVNNPNLFFRAGYTGPGFNSFVFTNPGDLVAGNWEVELDSLDVMAGHVFNLTPCFDVIVSAGVKLAVLDQEFRNAFIDLDQFGIGPGAPAFSERLLTDLESLSQELRGVGPRVGVETRVRVLDMLAVYGRTHTSLLIANREDESISVHNVRIDDRDRSSLGAGAVLRYEREEVVPVLEAAVGADLVLAGGRLVLGGGYEVQYWFNVGDSPSTNFGTFQGSDLSFDGWYGRIMVMF